MKTIEEIKLLGGRLCLDFVNTLDWRGSRRPTEYLNSYGDLILWCRRAGILDETESKALKSTAAIKKNRAAQIINKAVRLREAVYGIFYANIQRCTPALKDMTYFNKALSVTMRQSRIIRTEDGYQWDTNGNRKALEWILNPVICSAAKLLVSGDLKRVKACHDVQCGWLFFDTSRNRSRRWCDMKDCGNRAKALRFYNKSRKV